MYNHWHLPHHVSQHGIHDQHAANIVLLRFNAATAAQLLFQACKRYSALEATWHTCKCAEQSLHAGWWWAVGLLLPFPFALHAVLTLVTWHLP